MRSTRGDDHNNVVRKINATLQGPVIDTLAELVPDIRRLPRRNALEIILDDIDLLHRCFLAFRASPDRFRHLLVNRHKVSVEDAEALLECGRSLDDVVAMVVRTAAKRHFRRRLDGATKTLRARPPRTRPRRDLLARIRALLSQPTPTAMERPKTRGEALYDAFKEYLLHDWQVPMIPEYCTLSPGTVRRLGARILDYRIAEDIRRLKADPDNPPPPTPLVEDEQKRAGGYTLPSFLTTPKDEGTPTPITVAEKRVSDGMAVIDYADRTTRDERARLDDILTSDGKRLKANAFTIVLLDPQVRAALPHSEQTVRITGILGSVNGMAGKVLVGELGLRTDQLAVFLMSAHAALGQQKFETAFGVPGRPDYVARIVERAKAFKIDQSTSLPDIAAFIAKSFKVDPAKPA